MFSLQSHLSSYFLSEAIRFCFGPIIQKQLDELVSEWNHHYIRESRNSETPGGVPEVLYFLPERSGESDTLLDHYNLELLMHAGAQDYKHEVDPDLLDYADSNYGTKSSLFSSLFGDYANRLREDYSIPTPTTVDDAILLYFLLISDMNDMIS